MLRLKYLPLVLVLYCNCLAAENNKIFYLNPKEDWIDEIDNWEVKLGDDLEWKNIDAYDTSWIPLKDYRTRNYKGNWWIATIITITDTISQNKLLAILPDRIVSASEVFWDGNLIFSNGKIGNSPLNEVAGKYFQTVNLPRELSSIGKHYLALRISNWTTNSNWSSGQIFIGYYDSLLNLIFTWQIKIYFLIGILFLASIFFLFLFIASKKKINYLIFLFVCISVLLSLLVNYFWAISSVSNHYLDFKNISLPICITIIGILFPVYFLYEFEFPLKNLSLLIIGSHILLYLIYSEDDKLNEYILYLLIINLIFLTVWGMLHKKEGSFIVLFAITISILFYWLDLKSGIDNLTFFSVTLIFCYIFSISRKYAKNEKLKNEAYVRSIRMENQLLKKNINPHYLLNSLTSIIVWLKKEPKTAIKLIESLADEFRIVSQISNLEKIPLKKELELCETHLRIMNYRKYSDFKIEYHNINMNDEIPPMIFHTLVENGITHGYEARRTGKFILSKNSIPNGIQYTLFNDSSFNKNSNFKIGTGIKYVKARLEESYPHGWKMDSRHVNGGWEVKIEIYGSKM